MGKAFYSGILILFIGTIVFLHSCAKDKGQLPAKPFNFNLVEGFESSSALPSGWSLWNPDNDAKWQICTTVAHAGHNCIGFNNCSGNGTVSMTGKRDRFITATYDFSGATTASLSFDVAYAVLQVKDIDFTDSLAIYSSSDNGNTWTQIYFKGGTDLSNIPIITTTTPCWEPAFATDWRTDKINVSNLAGKSRVTFAFENRSDWGEWVYLDNITIAATNVGASCDKITYANNIKPIIISKCATPNCHVPGHQDPIDLDTYAGLKTIVDNGHFKKRVMDGNPSFMPTSSAGGKLDDATLSKIQCWLDNGAPNN
jgi:hypothetical protein